MLKHAAIFHFFIEETESMARMPMYRSQTGVLPLVGEGLSAKVVLITSRRRKKWILPKGLVEPNMTPQESALKEALEEAGVTGTIICDEPVGSYSLFKSSRSWTVNIYRMSVRTVLNSWPEKDSRLRCIVGLHEAMQMLSNPSLREIVCRGFSCSPTRYACKQRSTLDQHTNI